MTIEEKIRDQARLNSYLQPFADYICEELIKTPENIEKIDARPLKEVYEHVKGKAQKSARNNMAMIHKNEVYGWIREFYGISDLTVVKKPVTEAPASIFDLM